MDVGQIRVRQLQELTALLDHDSLSQAALSLDLTQATLSKHLRSLEQSLGAELFQRDYRLTLTPAGRMLAEAAVRIVNDVNLAVRSCRKCALEGVRELRIENTVAYFLPRVRIDALIDAFLDRRDDVLLRHVPITTDSLLGSIWHNLADAGYWYDFGDVEGIIARRERDGLGLIHLDTERMVVWAHSDHPIFQSKSVTARELAKCSIMAMHRYSHGRSYRIHADLFKTRPFEGLSLYEDVRMVTQFLDFLSLDPRESVYVLPESFTEEAALKRRRDMRWRYLDEGEPCQMFFAYDARSKNDIVLEAALYLQEHLFQA